VRLKHKYSSLVGRRCRRHHHAFVRSFATDTKQTESTLSRPRFKFQTRFHSIPFHATRTHARTHRRSPRLTEHSLRFHALSADVNLKRHEWLIYPSHSTSRLVSSFRAGRAVNPAPGSLVHPQPQPQPPGARFALRENHSYVCVYSVTHDKNAPIRMRYIPRNIVCIRVSSTYDTRI
jgi:hypothetical protein